MKKDNTVVGNQNQGPLELRSVNLRFTLKIQFKFNQL